MRPVTVFALSFVFSVVIGAVMLPSQPTPRSRPLARSVTVKPPSPIESATSQYVLLPSMPSLANVSTSPYETARQMMLKGRLREAQDLYLQILLANTPIDQQAMQGLARVQGLLAHGDVVTLQQQAETYRRTIARASDTGEGYSARALELLAEANLLAAQDVQAQQAPRFTAIGAVAPDVSGIPKNTLSSSSAATRGTKPVLPALMREVVRAGSALNPASASPPLPTVGGPSTANLEIVVPVPVPGSPGTSGGGTSSQGGAGSTSSWGDAPTGGTPGSGRGGNASSWGSEPAGTPTDKRNTNP